ncbi:MAG TPA: enoyl-ACP reductase [Candidatus Nanoarchaeia archaeon]|nr:enoyl-ACP reductase [Candidatus Nanoarchaeia archaeon]
MQKLPFKFRLQSNIYKVRLFLRRSIRKLFFWKKFRRNEDMGISINLAGKKAVVFGIANDKSIAWHIAKRLNDAGCRIFAAYQERVEPLFMPLMKDLNNPLHMKCDVVDDTQLDAFFKKVQEEFGEVDFLVHSIAFAKREHLQGKYMNIDRRGYQVAHEVSSYSLAELTRRTVPMMKNGGSIIAMTYLGSEKVTPGYNIMGVAKAALESSVRYLASDLGEQKIRVNAISAGPIATLAASGIAGLGEMLLNYVAKSPLKRNITADEVADCALFLCSDLSTGITGQVIYVDAGYSSMGI